MMFAKQVMPDTLTQAKTRLLVQHPFFASLLMDQRDTIARHNKAIDELHAQLRHAAPRRNSYVSIRALAKAEPELTGQQWMAILAASLEEDRNDHNN